MKWCLVAAWAFFLPLISLEAVAVVVQVVGEDFLVVEAEDFESVLNSDADNDVRSSVETGVAESPPQVWEVANDGAASGGNCMEAPPSPHKQISDATKQESVAVYRLRFETAGAYHVYSRARNNGEVGSTSSDSFWGAASFGAEFPDLRIDTGTSGEFAWRSEFPGTFEVTGGDIGVELEFLVGSRESLARVDTLVFSLSADLDADTLDQYITLPEPGTLYASTLAELDAAFGQAVAGDTIVMADGQWLDTDIVFDANGSAAAAITLRAETPGMVVLGGNSKIRMDGNYLVVDGLVFRDGYLANDYGVIRFNGSNCRATNCAIIDYSRPDDVKHKWVSIRGTNNRVDHCYFSGKTDFDVMLKVEVGSNPGNHLIDYNYFGERPNGGGNGYEIFRLGSSTVSHLESGTVVEYNYFHHCDGEAEIISNKSAGNVYRYNTFYECAGSLVIRHGKSATVSGNFFIGNGKSGTGGVRINDAYHTVVNNYFENLTGTGGRAGIVIQSGAEELMNAGHVRMRDSLLAFNTFVNCAETILVGSYHEADIPDGILTPENNTLANNIVLGRETPMVEIVEDFGPPRNLVWEGNMMYGSELGIPETSGIEIVDPMIGIAGDGLWRPQTGSPAINGAQGAYTDILDDMDGQARNDGTHDVGADERSTGAIFATPLTADDVGPDWMRMPRISGDSDGDGLPDEWEDERGLRFDDSVGAEGPDGDPDGDGLSNFEEFLRDTDPLSLNMEHTADINLDGIINSVDVQLVINAALGIDIGGMNGDVDRNGAINATDVQLVINTALGGL